MFAIVLGLALAPLHLMFGHGNTVLVAAPASCALMVVGGIVLLCGRSGRLLTALGAAVSALLIIANLLRFGDVAWVYSTLGGAGQVSGGSAAALACVVLFVLAVRLPGKAAARPAAPQQYPPQYQQQPRGW